jgi:hypothetical protein
MYKILVWALQTTRKVNDGYGFDLDLIVVLYKLCGSYPRTSGLVRKSNHLRPIYLRKVHLEVVGRESTCIHTLGCKHGKVDQKNALVY